MDALIGSHFCTKDSLPIVPDLYGIHFDGEKVVVVAAVVVTAAVLRVLPEDSKSSHEVRVPYPSYPRTVALRFNLGRTNVSLVGDPPHFL